MARVDIGEMRDRVSIRTRTLADDLIGGKTETWTTLATVWAKVNTIRGAEYIQQMQAGGELTHRVVMRYRSDVTAAMKLTWGSRTLKIVSPPIELGHRQWIEIQCKEETT